MRHIMACPQTRVRSRQNSGEPGAMSFSRMPMHSMRDSFQSSYLAPSRVYWQPKGSEDTQPPTLSLPRAQCDERIEYHPVHLQALAVCALARAKCPLGRNADFIDAGPPWRRLDALDQLRHPLL